MATVPLRGAPLSRVVGPVGEGVGELRRGGAILGVGASACVNSAPTGPGSVVRVRDGGAGEQLSGERLVERGGQREDVRRRADAARPALLGRHVGPRPAGLVMRAASATGCASSKSIRRGRTLSTMFDGLTSRWTQPAAAM